MKLLLYILKLFWKRIPAAKYRRQSYRLRLDNINNSAEYLLTAFLDCLSAFFNGVTGRPYGVTGKGHRVTGKLLPVTPYSSIKPKCPSGDRSGRA